MNNAKFQLAKSLTSELITIQTKVEDLFQEGYWADSREMEELRNEKIDDLIFLLQQIKKVKILK